MNNYIQFETFVVMPDGLFKLEMENSIRKPKHYKMYIMQSNFYLEEIYNLDNL